MFLVVADILRNDSCKAQSLRLKVVPIPLKKHDSINQHI